MLVQLYNIIFKSKDSFCKLEANNVLLLSFIFLIASTGDEETVKEAAKAAEQISTQPKPEYLTGEWLAVIVAICWFAGALTSMIFKK